MLLEVFQQIEAKEAQANQLVLEAKATARDILKSVEAAVADDERVAAQENRQTLQSMLDASKKEFSSVLDQTIQNRRVQELEKLQQCEKNMDETVNYIVERIIQHGIN